MSKENELKCECVEHQGELYQCEMCYIIEEEESYDKCTCYDGEININCRGCF